MAESISKKAMLLSGLLVAAVVAAFVFTKNQPEQESALEETLNSISEKEEAKALIRPPLKGVDIPFTTFRVIAEQGGSFDFKTGSRFEVPQHAFVGKDGQLLKGEIEIQYREFHDPLDFFVSGIPMTYDSAGTTYQFESAGMMEMNAVQHGEKVKMAAGKSINVELASKYDGTDYNLYKLDEFKNNWSCLGKDKVKKKKASPSIEVRTVEEKTAGQDLPEYQLVEKRKTDLEIEKNKSMLALPRLMEKPSKPIEVDDTNYTFNLDVNPQEFPELAEFKELLFEVGPENKEFNKRMYAIVWDEAIIKEGNKKGVNYTLTLRKASKKHELMVYPVFEGKDYEKALKELQQKFSNYVVALDKRKEKEKLIEEAYQEKLAEFKRQQKEIERKYEARMDKQFLSMDTEQQVTRLFAINSFGVYNCDTPVAYPTGVLTSAELLNENKDKINCYDVFLVDRQKNALFSYIKNPISKFSFNPESSNILWTVENGVLYWLKPEQFEKIDGKNEKSKIIMNRVDQPFKNVEEMKTFFNL